MVLWVIICGATAIVYLGVVVFIALRRPPPPLWPAILLTPLAALAWATGELGTTIATTHETKSLFVALLYSGSLPLPALFWLLALFALGWREAFVIAGILIVGYALLMSRQHFETPAPPEVDEPELGTPAVTQ